MATHRYDEHHRDLQGGGVRAAVFGASDGLVSNVLLIVGLAGADVSSGVVRTAGVAGLLAGAISMAAGEYVSVRAQNDLVARELEKERQALAEDPEEEIRPIEISLKFDDELECSIVPNWSAFSASRGTKELGLTSQPHSRLLTFVPSTYRFHANTRQ